MTWVKFTQSVACRSRAHCNACRNDAAWRKKIDPDETGYGCPIGYSIGQHVEVIRTDAGIFRTHPKCGNCQKPTTPEGKA